MQQIEKFYSVDLSTYDNEMVFQKLNKVAAVLKIDIKDIENLAISALKSLLKNYKVDLNWLFDDDLSIESSMFIPEREVIFVDDLDKRIDNKINEAIKKFAQKASQ